MEEIPFPKLEKIGINKEDVLSFPRPILEPLLSGKVTPLIMATITKPEGERVDIPLKLQLLRGKENNIVNVLAYPVRKEILNDLNLSRLELEKLQTGEVVRKEIKDNGRRSIKFLQLDQETKSILQKDSISLRLADRIKEIEKIGNIELGLEQKKAIHDGKPVELQTGDTTVTVGVDLKQPTGFRELIGNLQTWQLKQAEEYDRVTPGFMGYIKTEANRWEYQQVVNLLQRSSIKEIETKTNTQKLGV